MTRAWHAPVHVGQLDLVIVKEKQLANTAAGEHLGGDAAHAANAYYGHRVVANGLRH